MHLLTSVIATIDIKKLLFLPPNDVSWTSGFFHN